MTFWQWLASLFHKRPAPQPVPPPTPPNPDDPDGLVAALNGARLARALPALTIDPKLTPLARGWAVKLAAFGVLTHGDFAGRIANVYPDEETAENIAEGQPTADEVVAAWLASPLHRMNMLGNYNRVGVGRSGEFWVADFALLEV